MYSPNMPIFIKFTEQNATLEKVDLLDDVDQVKAKFNAALGMVRSRVRQAAHAVVAVSEQLDPQTVVLLT